MCACMYLNVSMCDRELWVYLEGVQFIFYFIFFLFINHILEAHNLNY